MGSIGFQPVRTGAGSAAGARGRTGSIGFQPVRTGETPMLPVFSALTDH